MLPRGDKMLLHVLCSVVLRRLIISDILVPICWLIRRRSYPTAIVICSWGIPHMNLQIIQNGWDATSEKNYSYLKFEIFRPFLLGKNFNIINFFFFFFCGTFHNIFKLDTRCTYDCIGTSGKKFLKPPWEVLFSFGADLLYETYIKVCLVTYQKSWK